MRPKSSAQRPRQRPAKPIENPLAMWMAAHPTWTNTRLARAVERGEAIVGKHRRADGLNGLPIPRAAARAAYHRVALEADPASGGIPPEKWDPMKTAERKAARLKRAARKQSTAAA